MHTLGGPGARAALLQRLESKLAHETHQTLSATADPLATQHLLETPSPISAPTLAKDRCNLFGQHLVLKAPAALGLKCVIIEPAATDPKGPAQFSATIAVRRAVESLSHLVELLGSWPKMAKAFFKMSRWRVTAASSRSSSSIRLWVASEALKASRPCWPYWRFHLPKEQSETPNSRLSCTAERSPRSNNSTALRLNSSS